MSTDPKHIVVKFLNENGYPFEMKVAMEFQKNGFEISQSVFFNDSNLNVTKEIDIVALSQETYHEKNFKVFFAVECKYAKTPWILFTSLSDRHDQHYIGSSSAWRWLNNLFKQEDFQHFFEITSKIGYGLITTISEDDKQKNNAYKAVQTIMSFLKSEISAPRFSRDEYVLVVPIISIKGKLFEAHLDNHGEVEVNEIFEGQLHYNEGTLGIIPRIHIVTDAVLPAYIENLAKDVKRLFNPEWQAKVLQIEEWERNGRPNPPPHIVKQNLIKELKRKFKCEVLVETGTYLGDMIEAQLNDFKEIYSIELSQKLFNKAKDKFKNYSQVTILNGDSGIVLNKLMDKIDKPTIFWLDGHWSGGITAKAEKECPVPEELEAILKSSLLHVILIDDARLFNGTHDYPTIDEIKKIIVDNGQKYILEVKDDIIQLTPS
jgi:hypothetical protein